MQNLARRGPRPLVQLHRSQCARPTQCRAAAQIKEVTSEELEVVLAERSKPMIIDFYADWCGPCVLLADELKKVAEDVGDAIRIYKVNTETNEDLCSQLQIQGLPTMIFIGTNAEEPALRTEGLLPAQSIKDVLDKMAAGTATVGGEAAAEAA